MKNKKVLLTVTILMISFALSACGHEHEWEEATCTTPKTCVTCEETEGEALGHEWEEATCTEPKTCVTCEETEREALGHEWEEATCTEPKTCVTCGETEGEALGHEWEEATCIEPKTCVTCGETEGELTEHDLNDTGKCRVCGEQVGFALNMSNYKDYISVKTTVVSSIYGATSQTVETSVEPLRNVEFCNVRVTLRYTDTDGKETTKVMGVLNSGYAGPSTYKIKYGKKVYVDSVSGYVIE